MCGIAGFTHQLDLSVARDRLAAMLQTIRYRGPDGVSGIAGDGFALGNARLAIVDIEGGQQPAISADGRVSIVFNGEIFNYRELRTELMGKGFAFRTSSEIETLLNLYLDQGINMVRRLNGQFAIAIHDRRSGILHLVRDPFGIRPLFWRQVGTDLVFGSETKALAAFDKCGFELDRESFLQTLRFWTVTGDRTVFAGVRQVPPGYRLEFDKGKAELYRYWTFPSTETVPPLSLKCDEDYFEAFRSKFCEAIERQRMADVKVGCYVSGGIDSSAVACSLSEIIGREALDTFSIAFNDAEYDESGSQQALVKHLNLRNQTIRIGTDDIANSFPDVVRHAETPLFRTAPVPLYFLSRKVHESGIKVVMTGEGSDEILLGYDLFRETQIRRFWQRNPASKWRGQLFRSLYQYLPQYRNPRYFNLLLDFYRGTLGAEGLHYAMAVRWSNGKALEGNLTPDMQALADRYDPVAELERWLPPEYLGAGDVERAQHIELMTLLPNYLLSSQGDRMSLAHSVEGRYPYLDLEFVRFAASLPQRIKLRGLKDKFILRRAFADKLPEALANRPKFAYQAPELKAFFRQGKLVEYAAELLSEGAIRELGLFEPRAVARLVALGSGENVGRLGFRDNMAFVLLLSTALLQQQFRQWRGDTYASSTHSITLQERI
jgi:asparagine synthase (glutamine-hydrolysing)